MAETLFIEVVTPERAVFAGEVEEIVLPGSEGQMGILPGHLPLLSSLGIGEMIVRGYKGSGESSERRFLVDGGFVEVLPNKVSVMTESCDGFDQIDVAAARTAIEEAEKALLSLETRSTAEQIEEEVFQTHHDALKRARMRLLMAEDQDD